jgi:U3 small nucleolar RNA-associated protein 15
MYAPIIGQAPLIDALFLRMRKKVAEELRFQEEVLKAKGALTMILSSAVLECS